MFKHRVFFADEETAIAAGYRPCGVCTKKAYKKWREINSKKKGDEFAMRYILSNKNYDYYGLPIEVERFCKMIEDLDDVGIDLASIADWYDILTESMEFHADYDYGIYHVAELEDNCRDDLLALVDDNHDFDIDCSQIDDENNTLRTAKISLSPYLKEFVGNLDYYGIICHFIEDSLSCFVEESKWQYAMIDKSNGQLYKEVECWPSPQATSHVTKWFKDGKELSPIIWFGPLNSYPLKPWTIDRALSPVFRSNDTWEVMKSVLVDPDDSFLIWYCAEVGCLAPDTEEILETCPLHFLLDEDDDSVKNKVDDFFLRLQENKQHGLSETLC